jgi:hypothetical protein
MSIQGGPDIVENGLVYYVDAGNFRSYPRSGTTWSDISGNNKNGSLQNGPTFDSANGGSILFDGTNDVVNFGTGNTFFPLPQFTIDIWFRSLGTVPTTGTSPGLFGFTFGITAIFTSATNLLFRVDDGTTTEGITITGTFRTDGNWYNGTFYHTGTNMGIYINGSFRGSVDRTWNGTGRYATNSWNLGRDNNNSNQFFYGNIASCKLYNRQLSADEILQNYNATRSRFGI